MSRCLLNIFVFRFTISSYGVLLRYSSYLFKVFLCVVFLLITSLSARSTNVPLSQQLRYYGFFSFSLLNSIYSSIRFFEVDWLAQILSDIDFYDISDGLRDFIFELFEYTIDSLGPVFLSKDTSVILSRFGEAVCFEKDPTLTTYSCSCYSFAGGIFALPKIPLTLFSKLPPQLFCVFQLPVSESAILTLSRCVEWLMPAR